MQRAIDAIARACFRSFSRIPGAQLIDDDGVFGAITEVPLTFFNGIATTDVADAHADRVVAGTVERFQLPFRWWISPSTKPHNLAAILQAHGLSYAWDSAGMTADLTALPLDTPPPPGIAIEQATELQQDFIRVLLPVFERPASDAALWIDAYKHLASDWTHFVAYDRGAPVATTSLLMAGELAGIYLVATLPEARGRGISSAINVAAMRHARAAGATTAVLQSSEMGFNVYRGIGFVPVAELTLYEWRGAPPSAAADPAASRRRSAGAGTAPVQPARRRRSRTGR